MPDLSYSISVSDRRRGDFPFLPVTNMLAENIPSEPSVVLQSRPGLENDSTAMGLAGVKALYQADGVLNNSLFGVSGTDFYKDSTLVGSIDGTGYTSFAGYDDYVFVNSGAGLWSYDGTTLSQIAFPDSADITKVLVAASRIVTIRKDTDTIYWSDPLGVTIDALDFASAENSPDSLKDMLFVGDKLLLFGKETIEVWPTTTDADLPFAPLVGATIPLGIKDTGLAQHFNRTFAWITNHNEVCVQDPDNIISDPELQVKIEKSSEVALWTFYVDDNEYLAVQLDEETWVYGARTQVWSLLSSYGESRWVCQCFDNGVFGTNKDGTLVKWSDDYSDFDGEIERRFRAWVPLTSGSVTISNIILRTNPGHTPFLSGDFSEPVVELRTSRDGGVTWMPWKQRTLGQQGQYSARTIWASMGQFSYPGLLVDIRTTDPIAFRVSGLVFNEPFGGM